MHYKWIMNRTSHCIRVCPSLPQGQSEIRIRRGLCAYRYIYIIVIIDPRERAVHVCRIGTLTMPQRAPVPSCKRDILLIHYEMIFREWIKENIHNCLLRCKPFHGMERNKRSMLAASKAVMLAAAWQWAVCAGYEQATARPRKHSLFLLVIASSTCHSFRTW